MVGQSRFQTRKCQTEDRLYETQAKKFTGEAGLLRTTHALCGRHLVFSVLFYLISIPYLGIKCKSLFSKFREKPVTTEKLSPRPVEWTSTECSLLIISSLVRIHINCTMIKRHPLTSTYHFLSQVVIGSIFFIMYMTNLSSDRNRTQYFKVVFHFSDLLSQGISKYFRDINKLWNSLSVWWKLHVHSKLSIIYEFFITI